jgi:N-glycosylase/DNA lyase
MTVFHISRLDAAIAAIYPDIVARVAEHRSVRTERRLWWEISSCVLSSQVPYPIAAAAADELSRSGKLLSARSDKLTLATELEHSLLKPLTLNGRMQRYRFPTARSRQLAELRCLISSEFGTLKKLVKQEEATVLREWLVRNAPGLGPKQSSMFLRNIGLSYDFAILDRHVLTYMVSRDLCTGSATFVSRLTDYYRHEQTLRDHASVLGFSVGLLDWAIWIVMRAVNGIGEKAS